MAIYDSYAMRKFMEINFMTDSVPGETALCNFRHLLEENGLNKLFFDAINRVMVETGHMMKGATIIDAPSSIKNAGKKWDPEIHSAKKGNQWRLGMKCRVGVDTGTGYVHRIEVTAANVHDVTVASGLIREDDEVVYVDSAYLGLEKRMEVVNDEHLSSIEHRVNLRPGRFPKVSDNAIDCTLWIEKQKFSVRCKVEHIFRIIKCQFGYRKTRYRSLKKNGIGCMPCLPAQTATPWRWPDAGCEKHDRGLLRLFQKRCTEVRKIKHPALNPAILGPGSSIPSPILIKIGYF